MTIPHDFYYIKTEEKNEIIYSIDYVKAVEDSRFKVKVTLVSKNLL